jgi:hypothetical protein
VDGTGDDKVGRPQQHGQHQQDIGRAREEAIRVMMMSNGECGRFYPSAKTHKFKLIQNYINYF